MHVLNWLFCYLNSQVLIYSSSYSILCRMIWDVINHITWFLFL